MNSTTRPDTPVALGRTKRRASLRRLARVLVIDDDPLILNATRRILGKDHDVACAMGAAIARTVLESGAPEFDAIVCGLELRSTILAISPQLAERMIFVSQPLDFAELRRSILACRRRRQGEPAL
ncbi:MAG: hypothetical protein ABIP89_09015 [Polyangiaceae bacterium]